MIEPCAKCGHQVRLGAMRITFNRKRGVAHYLAHIGHTTCSAAVNFNCQMLKPYPTPRPYETMIARWNAEQGRVALGLEEGLPDVPDEPFTLAGGHRNGF